MISLLFQNKYCNSIRPLYASAMVVRTPDIDVEKTGIAGGQRSILDKELIDANQPHLIPEVDIMVQIAREQGGKVCQVTPAADSYAREALRRLRGGDAGKNFAPGYAAILTGECGAVKEPVVVEQQKQALLERTIARANALLKSNTLKKEVVDELVKPNGALKVLRDQMFTLAEPVQTRARIAEVEQRIKQLNLIKSNKDLNDSLNRKIELASETVNGKVIRTIDDRLAILNKELSGLQTLLKSINSLITDEVSINLTSVYIHLSLCC
jgi:pyruvate/oxaloacetate carboxyltransferase